MEKLEFMDLSTLLAVDNQITSYKIYRGRLHIVLEPDSIHPTKPLPRKATQPIALNDEDKKRIIEMAWQDRTHFDVIYKQFGITENQLKKMMRTLISPKAYKRWRKRVQGRTTKHAQKCLHKPTRFEGPW